MGEEGRKGQDESTHKPYLGSLPLQFPRFSGWVAADLEFANGSHWFGIFEVAEPIPDEPEHPPELCLLFDKPIRDSQDCNELSQFNQIVMRGDDRIHIGMVAHTRHFPDSESQSLIRFVYSQLCVERGQLFPIRVKSRVPIEGRPDVWEHPGWTRPDGTLVDLTSP
ncbi:MAG: hypothetical protein KDA31_01690 [Phycisphaerales bacterium]|nr:hypothetical protein [Phycisphaerales bacterium]MCB9835183.1 hypothetical protein [Phycisphaera sp.]